MKQARTITGGQVAKYMLLPGLIPRLQDLLSGGFGFIAVFMAQIYGAARLLPPGHPFLLPANAGKFSIRQVVTAAGNRLVYKRENIDQVLVFYILLAGLVILGLQFFFLAMAIFVGAAHAGSLPSGFTGFFGTPNAQNDIAFVLLDRVFGVPGVFLDNGGGATCVANDAPCFSSFNPNSNAEGTFPWPYHIALHGMLQFYSIGLLVIAVMIFLYYIFAVAAETAQTGKPFGRRFNHVWAPIRMVAALGLLIPMPSGLNSSQYILLYAAKWGSGFATNGWKVFTDTIVGETLAGDPQSLIAAPTLPNDTSVDKLLEFMTVAETCRALYEENTTSGKQIVRAYLVRNTSDPTNQLELQDSTSYQDALDFYDNQDVMIRFGSCLMTDTTTGGTGTTVKNKDCDEGGGDEVYKNREGYVEPLCGELVLPVVGPMNQATNAGAYDIQEGYFNLIRDAWLGGVGGDTGNTSSEPGYSGTTGDVCDTTSPGTYDTWLRHWGYCFVEKYGGKNENGVDVPDKGDYGKLLNGGTDVEDDASGGYLLRVQTFFDTALTDERTGDDWTYAMQDLGWGGAAIWYNKIAQMNGAMMTAASNTPRISHYPEAMENVARARLSNDAGVTGRETMKPELSKGTISLPGGPEEVKFADVLWKAYDSWDPMFPKASGESVNDIMTAIFGRQNLFNLRDPANAHVQPLALLAGLGDSLINTAVYTLGGGAASGMLGMLLPKGGMSSLASALSSLLMTIGFSLLSVGFILYYVVPFMPFIYFFFAIGAWIKGIFEAMVGVPLWALAHIRISGDGLPGPSAAAGYFMILEIFLRPILIVFGLLASIALFSAQVFVLNDIWELVTSNLTGFDTTNPVAGAGGTGTGAVAFLRDKMDQFFFTIIYAFLVYMLGMSSFKLITLLPQGIMRWIGSSAKAFGDQEDDPAKGVIGRMGAVSSVGNNLANAGVTNAGKAFGAAKDQANSGKPPQAK